MSLKNQQQSVIPPISNDVEIKQIGQGSDTQVFCCKSKTTSKKVILKSICHSEKEHKPSCYNMKNEYQILKTLDHPNIIKVKSHNCAQSNGQFFCTIQLEYKPTDLFTLMQDCFPRINFQEIRTYFKQISHALNYLHQEKGICHLDVKPENIVLDREKQQAKLIDFGFSKIIKNINYENFCKTWEARSKLYLAPEIEKMCQKIDLKQSFCQSDIEQLDWEKIDVFALGITFFCNFFFKSAFSGNRVSRQDPLYKLAYQENFQQFWSQDHQIQQFLEIYSQENKEQTENLTDLLFNMIRYQKDQRFTFQQVIEHPFFSN